MEDLEKLLAVDVDKVVLGGGRRVPPRLDEVDYSNMNGPPYAGYKLIEPPSSPESPELAKTDVEVDEDE